MYLPPQAVFTTLRATADVSPAGSTVIFDYLDTGALISKKATKRLRYVREATRRIGEPLLTSFDSSTLAPRRGLHLAV